MEIEINSTECLFCKNKTDDITIIDDIPICAACMYQALLIGRKEMIRKAKKSFILARMNRNNLEDQPL